MNKPITYSLFVLIFLFISNIGYALSVSPREPNSPLISKNSMTADSLEFFGLKFQNNGTTKIMFDSVASNAQYHLKIYSALPTNFTTLGDVLDTICSTFEMVSSVFADEDTFYCYARQLPTGDWCEYIYVTPATIRDFPYFEDFSSAYANNEFPDGWIVLEGNDMFPHISHHSFNYRSGNRGSLYFNASEGYNRVVLPYIITDTLSNYELCFNYYNSYSPAWLNVGLMSDSNGVKEYEVLRSVDIGSASSTPSSDVWRNWNTMYINLPNSSDKRHIFFSVSSSSSASVIIDNVVIKSRSALDQVHFFYPRSIGENDVILEWDDKHISNVSIKVSSMSINPNEEDGDIVSEVTPSIFSYPLIGLSPNTKYYCYAKAIHPYYGQSKWGQENTFTTLASSIGVPYNVNFSGCELGKEGVPSDLYIYNTGDVFCYEDISPAIVEVHNTDSTVLRALSLNRYKEVISGKYTILEETYLFLPKFYGSILDYYIDLVATTNSANSKLLIGTTQCPNDISSFVPYQSITLGHQTNFRIYMDNCIDDRGYITLLMETSNNNELASCYIESIYVGNMTNLHDVNNIRVNNVTSKSCNISWSSINKNDVQWRVKVVEALDYKEGMNWFNITNFTVDTVVNIHSIHLNGLNPNQYYFFLINPIDTLGVEHESYEKNNYFQTLCAPFELPYTPGFTAVDSATRIFPECFNVHVSDNSSPIFVCSDNELDMTFNEGQPVYLEFPEFLCDSIQELTISFSALPRKWRSTISIGVYSNTFNKKIFIPLDSISINQTTKWISKSFSFKDYIGNENLIGICITNNIESTRLSLKDIIVTKDLHCTFTHTCEIEQHMDSSMTIIFPDFDRRNSWDLVVVPEGTPLEEGTIINCAEPYYRYSGLLPNSKYVLYVRANCVFNKAKSFWSEPLYFTTPYAIATVPYITNFASDANEWQLINGTQTNQFAITNDGLYITSDSNYLYDIDYRSTVYARRDIELEIGDYQVDYIYSCIGEVNYDYASIYLIPQNEMVYAGTTPSSVSSSSWIKLNSQNLVSQNNTPDSVNTTISISKSNVYSLLIFWSNNASGGTQPPLKLYSFAIEPLTCSELKISEYYLTDNEVRYSWVTLFDSVRTIIINNNNSIIDTVFIGNSFNVEGLTPSASYQVFFQGYCNGLVISNKSLTLTMPCSSEFIDENNSLADNYNTIPISNNVGVCWTELSHNGNVENNFSNTLFESGNYSYSINVTKGDVSYIVSPCIQTISLNDLELEVNLRVKKGNIIMEVGVMTNPNDYNTFITIKNFNVNDNNSFMTYHIPFTHYTGDGKYIAIKFAPTVAGSNNVVDISLDSYQISKANSCKAVDNVFIYNLRANSFAASWRDDANCNGWLVELFESVNPDRIADKLVSSTFVTEPNIMYTQLETMKHNYVKVTKQCSDSSFTEPCFSSIYNTECDLVKLPYFNSLSSEYKTSDCFYLSSGLNMLPGSGVPLFITNEYNMYYGNGGGFDQEHLIYYNSDNSTFFFSLISLPLMYLEENSVCSFDFFIDRINIANTSKFKLKIFIMDYSTSFNIDNSSVTYPIDTVMDGIKNFTVDLSDYAYKTVKIIILMDFQVSEKFTSHLGNLYVRQASICSITEEICPTTVYTKNGFDIVDEQLQTPGTYRYTKEIENSEGVDSIASLILKVMNRKDNIINYRICPGETVYYKDIPFTEEGSSYFYYTSTQGCDSADVVQIVHMPTYDYIDYQYIVPELLPYSYGDTVFNRDTPYGIYHYRQELKSSEGCDSIVTLELSVQKELSVSEPSCFYIETYPNPQQVGESITLIANNMQESHFPCKVELFNSVGTLITQTEVTMFPTKIYGMNQSGVYMLRVTTAKNTVVYQKIIIK